MNVNVNVKRKFKVNGKEYNSIEEMPQDIRSAFEKAMASKTGSGQQVNTATMQTKIIFNGTEYQSIDVMPQDEPKSYGTTNMGNPTKIEPSAFSPRMLIIGVMVIALIILFYFLFQGR